MRRRRPQQAIVVPVLVGPGGRQPSRGPVERSSNTRPLAFDESLVLDLVDAIEGRPLDLGSGRAIGCVSWDGRVHADQFWRNHTFGNVRERPFSEIWTDPDIELLARLKEKKKHVNGRCAKCRWLDICGGNFRVRAEAVTGDVWAPDPACYLTDEEIQ